MAPRGDSPRVTPMRELPDDSTVSPQPPTNTEAEQALLGAILINNAAYGRVSEFLAPEHFANAVHGRIFAAMGTLIERGQIANPVSLKNLFDQDGALVEIGGAQYLARLAESAVTIINAEHYGRTILDLHLRRELITIGQDVVTEAFRHDLDDPAVTQIERAEQKLYLLATSGRTEGGPKSASVALDEALAAAELTLKAEGRITGIPTGLDRLNKSLGGLHRSDFIVIGGRPSMGKTGLAMEVAYAAARDNHGVVFFSLEMSAKELMARLLAAQTGISAQDQRRGPLSLDEMYRLIEETKRLKEIPLEIDDTPGASVSHIRAVARRRKRKHSNLGLIVVDYLQLIRGEKPENRFQEVSAISRSLKALAKELDLPVLATCQLSRKVEERTNKRPVLADLRESGQIEQDADVIIFLYREEYYLAREGPQRGQFDSEEKYQARVRQHDQRLTEVAGKAEIIIAKNRPGALDALDANFDAERIWFTDPSDR